MTLDQVQAFLVLCEELHFGRTADRLYRSQPRVSRLIKSLEGEIGGALFERTSRQVKLTSLGAQLESRLRPAYDELLSATADATRSARSVTGALRVGLPSTVQGEALFAIIDAFLRSHPGCEVTVAEIDNWWPYTALRAGEVDVLCSWLALDEADLTAGPVIDRRNRVLAVSSRHRLATRESVSIEELAHERVNRVRDDYPSALLEAILPARTPSGKPIPRSPRMLTSTAESITAVARGQVVHLTVESEARFAAHPDIVLVPVSDAPPIPIGLIWVSDRSDALLRTFVETAATVGAGRSRRHGQDADRGRRES
jgi:DNA-binding transcriptional LysR family regulator